MAVAGTKSFLLPIGRQGVICVPGRPIRDVHIVIQYGGFEKIIVGQDVAFSIVENLVTPVSFSPIRDPVQICLDLVFF
jgi:hypothetical protein